MKRQSTAYGPALNDGRSHYYNYGDRVCSYRTCIWQRAGELTLRNVTKYSVTTSRHQAKLPVAWDVLLDDVPEGTIDLLALAMQRGLVVWPAPPVPEGLLPGSVLE